MSSISGIGGASSAWSDVSAQRTAMRDKMFSKIDSDGSGEVDAGELSSMLNRISGGTQDTDASSTQATALLKKMDIDGDGALSADELEAGTRALMGPPPSTMQFAQASDSNGDGQVSGSEAAAMKNDLTSAFDTALQLLQSPGSAASSSTSTADDSSSAGTGDDSPAQAAARLAAMVMNQYARFSDATAQQSSSFNVSLAV